MKLNCTIGNLKQETHGNNGLLLASECDAGREIDVQYCVMGTAGNLGATV